MSHEGPRNSKLKRSNTRKKENTTLRAVVFSEKEDYRVISINGKKREKKKKKRRKKKKKQQQTTKA